MTLLADRMAAHFPVSASLHSDLKQAVFGYT